MNLNKRKYNGQFKKGVSGNYKGRPDKAKEVLQEILGEKDAKRMREIAQKHISAAVETGDWDMLKNMLDRAYGKPTQNINHEGASPVEIVVGKEQKNKLKKKEGET